MKPRNKYERHIVEMSEKLPAITEHQKEYALMHTIQRYGMVVKKTKTAWCTHCGGVFSYDNPAMSKKDKITMKCPHCGKTITMKLSRERGYSEKEYFTIMSVVGEYQVIRQFMVDTLVLKGDKPRVSVNEVVQMWYDKDFKKTVLAKGRFGLSGYYDAWVFSSELSIKDYCRDLSIESFACWPYSKVVPLIKRNGFRLDLFQDGIEADYLIDKLLTDPYSEQLLKMGQRQLFYRYCYRAYEFEERKHIVRIVNKNHYAINDASLYYDYIQLLEYFNLDTHNAHYLCPENLHEAHDVLHRRKERMLEEERIEMEMLRMKGKLNKNSKMEVNYRRQKGAFFDLQITNKDLYITVLPSVLSFFEEGVAMRHCVFSMGYYKKPKSLILSAKNKKGERVETIEVDLNTFKIVQSRGKCNKSTLYHEEILKLMRENMYKIRNIKLHKNDERKELKKAA